ncbi:YdcF family protein [Metabacillus sp. RGM 3146]|uniref:YdcF family protein n=1 Tax=Metabacillus sp. RGM 3146 TaxID=3401092 RepID=UPI003B99A0CA
MKKKQIIYCKYLEKNKETIAIASGGKGDGENITEAEAIQKGLIALGISKDRIMLEQKSTNTLENFRFSKPLLKEHWERGVVVTNDYHLYRSLMIAKDNGLHATALSAKTPSNIVIQAHFREYLSLSKYFLIDKHLVRSFKRE